MSQRRSSHHAVQLFPFLAVLMCALGALILLLLVITGKMREQLRAEMRQQRAAAALAQRQSTEPALLPDRDHWQPSALPPAAKLEPSAVPPTPQPSDALRSQWLRTVTDLQAAIAAEEAALQSARVAAESAELSFHSATTRLAELQQNAAAEAERLQSSEANRERSVERLGALELAVARESAAVTELREQRKAAASRYSVLAYDGRTGTVRRPIYIECTESGLTFASEKITLTPDQLNGYAAVHNPLRAGADALIDYWSVKALKNPGTESVGPPYVLLIVRPQGTIGYYVARRMLEALGQQFGYELVSEDLQLQWPRTDPEAVAACRAAIDAAIRDRERYAIRGYAPPGSLEPLSVSDGSGAFALEEVDRLRGDGKKVNVGGREFDRTPGATSGGGFSGRGGGGRTPTSSGYAGANSGEPGFGRPPKAPGADVAGGEPSSFPNAMAEREFPAAAARGTANSAPTGGFAGTTAETAPPGGAYGTSASRGPRGGPHGGMAGDGQPGAAPGAGAPQGGRPMGAASPEGIAANSAAGFSSAVGNRGRTAMGESPAPAGEGGDLQPSPLPSLETLQAQDLARSRMAQRNPGDVLRDPGSQIGLEHKVNVRVEAQRIVVESELPITIVPGMSREQLQSEFAATLQAHFEGWGRPPRSFYWLPQIRFTVLPGGHQNLKRLTDLTEQWEMSSKVDHALE